MKDLSARSMAGAMQLEWTARGATYRVPLSMDPERPDYPALPYAVRCQREPKGVVTFPLYKRIAGHRPHHPSTTRQLDADAKSNRIMVAKALAEAQRLGLCDKAVAERLAEEAAAQERRLRDLELAMRAALVTEANTLDAQGHLAAKDGAAAIRRYLREADQDSLLRLRRLLSNAAF